MLYGPEQESVLEWPMKLIDSLAQAPAQTALYDLEVDPLESQDIASSNGAAVSRLKAAAREVSPIVSPRGLDRPQEIDDETLRELEALGYAQPQPE